MFEITDEDVQAFLGSYVESIVPLVIKEIPAKEKRKYIILCIVIHYFEMGKFYTEKEINEILKPMVDDFVMIRRYLVDYHFLERKTDGSRYWLVKDPSEFKRFDLRKNE